MWKTTDKLRSEVTLDICGGKYQIEIVKKALKSLLKLQWYTVDIKFLNVYAFSLEMHLSNILNSEEEMKKELINIDVICQQFNKIML